MIGNWRNLKWWRGICGSPAGTRFFREVGAADSVAEGRLKFWEEFLGAGGFGVQVAVLTPIRDDVDRDRWLCFHGEL